MSRLITIAERIKVITNIQKTAHAMQLISMSTLSRVNSKKKAFQNYTLQLEDIIQELGLTIEKESAESTQFHKENSRTLYLIIGSQKGFCGSFNIGLFHFIKELQRLSKSPFTALAVGPYAYDFCKEHNISLISPKIIASLNSITEKIDLIFNTIMEYKDSFDTITVISNHNSSIFLQKPQKVMIPLAYLPPQEAQLIYPTEQTNEEIFKYINNLALKNQLFQFLLESLRAENSARALAMDSSTRNAKNLLTEMKLIYNKLRQAKVTKELTELSSSLLD